MTYIIMKKIEKISIEQTDALKQVYETLFGLIQIKMGYKIHEKMV